VLAWSVQVNGQCCFDIYRNLCHKHLHEDLVTVLHVLYGC
jgi:hypothetical protein